MTWHDKYTDFYIGGRWVAPSSTETLPVVSPFTEQPIATVPAGNAPVRVNTPTVTCVTIGTN